ncbi:predicted protein [Botrytis cinerea T4]|uniref:Uncharacterized protein n=1 Tax=Botryotinia fuckeliana (strain T4) TaxID=999810 RepID=G2XWY7_BOTF4|nr:predicted protein [Botrytis cinerea T4]
MPRTLYFTGAIILSSWPDNDKLSMSQLGYRAAARRMDGNGRCPSSYNSSLQIRTSLDYSDRLKSLQTL